ncbi:DUF2065 domain-containing protein [Halothiobacillus sp.]|uniref:DUF2065 domain-containing protein n=1 Tax=Halothiobacillus sp. TaxID=1891311 RepID=UPI003A1027FE
MGHLWLQVIGLVLVIEALMPFISPRNYRSMALRMAGTSDKTLRFVALIALGLGVLLLSLAHY